jgi:hypothetical protein
MNYVFQGEFRDYEVLLKDDAGDPIDLDLLTEIVVRVISSNNKIMTSFSKVERPGFNRLVISDPATGICAFTLTKDMTKSGVTEDYFVEVKYWAESDKPVEEQGYLFTLVASSLKSVNEYVPEPQP